MRGVLLVSLVSIGLTSLGCAKRASIAERERVHAPTGIHDVGVLVDGASKSEIENILTQHPEAQVRVLNSQQGFYEIFGVKQDEVTRQTDGQVSQNVFFKLQQDQVPALAKILSADLPEGTKLPGFNKCRKRVDGPSARINLTKPMRTRGDVTIQLGQSIQFDSLASTGANLKSLLVIYGPSFSEFTETLKENTSQFEFKPDALGVYDLAVAVQDANDACSAESVSIVVTDNPKYDSSITVTRHIDLAKFVHLSEVSAEEAWRISEGNGVTIAVIDTGINYNHPYLAQAIATNPGEIPNNGIDDDHNGLIDDVVGYDFVNHDPMPFDDGGHGSHVAGLAAGREFGLARAAKVLAIKALNTNGGDLGTISAAIRYSVDRGARIINMSLGSESPDNLPHPAMQMAINYADAHDALIVAASGNGDQATRRGFDIDQKPTFPAALPNKNLISIGAFDADNVITSYSNFGHTSVDILAPGGMMPNDPMYSAASDNPKGALFVGMVGTSMATPVASGIAAQVLAVRPQLSAADLRLLLMSSGKKFPELRDKSVTGRHLDALAALQCSTGVQICSP